MVNLIFRSEDCLGDLFPNPSAPLDRYVDKLVENED